MNYSIERIEKLTPGFLMRQRAISWRTRWKSWTAKGATPRPIFLFSYPRTGSSLLAGYFHQHPDVLDCGELLNQRISRGLHHRKIGAKHVTRHIGHTLRGSKAEHCLIKLHFNHLKDRKTTVGDITRAFPAAGLVVLYRRDILAQYCSQLLATATRQFRSSDKSTTATVRLEIASWREYRSNAVSAYRDAISILNQLQNQYQLLCYEELASTPSEAISESLFPALGLSQITLAEPVLRKQERRPLDAVISNYEEVSPHICGEAKLQLNELTS